jgi:hypothetical protein
MMIKDMARKEFILCASVMFNNRVVSARRHKDCYKLLEGLLGIDINISRKDQGFLTSNGRHVDRKEGFKIAKDNDQIWHKMHDDREEGELTSEDLYWDEEIDN